MAAVNFSEFIMSDEEDAVTLESVYKRYASFAGVQSFSFDNSITGFDATKWTTVSDVTLGSVLTQTVLQGSDVIVWHNASLPHSYTMEFTYYKNQWGAVVRGDGSSSYYKIEYNATYMTIEKYESGVVTTTWTRQNLVSDIVNRGRIKITVRDAQFTSDSPGRIVYISIWLNDRPLISVADNVSTNNPPLRMGILVPSGMTNGMVYSDFRVPNLGETIQWSSLSPREHPADAISRAIEDRYIKSWMRWDGTLRAWIPSARSVSVQITSDREYSLTPVTDSRQAFSRLRVLGAFQWIQMKDDELLRGIGDRFAEISNTSLWNADDCYRIGLQMFMRAKEQVFQAQMSSAGYPFLEVEDRIQIPNYNTPGGLVDYIVDSASWDYENGVFSLHLNGRKYYHGEP